MNSTVIPIFYACDDNFIKYTVVSLYSIIKNASKDYKYRVHVLHTEVAAKTKEAVLALANENFDISFDNVSEYLEAISRELPIRDYYSKTTYYRLFIAKMFPEYKKAIYIDSDTVVQGDISELYNIEIGDAYLGACHEQAMVQVDEYGTYAERVVGVSRYSFFNAGMILINCDQFRRYSVLENFLRHLNVYNFVVTQDEDYLNLICKDRVYWLDQRWNTEIFGEIPYPIEEAKILHYIMVNKPWHYADCRHGDIFWRYAEYTSVFEELCEVISAYTDEERARDQRSMDNLLALAVKETNREDNYLNRINKMRAKDRVAILAKIEEYERAGRFDEDVEEDPPSKELLPEDVDYFRRSPLAKAKTKMAFTAARRYVQNLIDTKQLIIKEIRGIEHLQKLQSGAIITCNHFNAYDSFAIQLVYDAAKQPKRKFYRVIREGNYTSFPGFYGMLMRNCNTLPLSSNRRTLKKFTEATGKLLRDGHFVLVYPEQSMWWNYRKPKPLKPGAFMFAAKNDVPVVPCFITMRDSDVMGEDGFNVQEYTVHVCAPIYPDETKNYRQNTEMLMAKNYELWKEIYEREYGMPLVYTTEKR
ncbi:MAG: 1-acyl-sn-glycerol-3-phosphate acyltransferase [Clostridia bacterium]|nr:1-acyl-sn-glycerol-3-phosphate acyltransferase [Clostridia bacterium]MBQ9761095.1 1-acyl-sn-glycerol-3-phosphate acyltransferase [Clostridia bacterium]